MRKRRSCGLRTESGRPLNRDNHCADWIPAIYTLCSRVGCPRIRFTVRTRLGQEPDRKLNRFSSSGRRQRSKTCVNLRPDKAGDRHTSARLRALREVSTLLAFLLTDNRRGKWLWIALMVHGCLSKAVRTKIQTASGRISHPVHTSGHDDFRNLA